VKKDLEKRTKQFSLDVIKFTASLPRNREADVLARQLLRSSTSIGANYRKANRTVSRPDFGNKIGTVQKEASETQYWLELFVESNLIETPPVKLHAEASELLAIFSAIWKKKNNVFLLFKFYLLLGMTILGLNAYHGDSAACLIVDGKLVAAAEEERFRRIKHWAGLPTMAIDYCLREGRMALRDVDHLAINRQPGVNNRKRLAFVLTHRPSPKLMWQKIKNIRSAASVKDALEQHYGHEFKAELHYVEHHLAHLASAYLVSGFNEAACISIDGFGDFASTAIGFGQGDDLTIDNRIYFPHSLGIFYSALTQFIGFPHYGDEYKVMGLAPYGEPKYVEQLRDVLVIQADGMFQLNLKYFRHHTDNVSYSWQDCAPEVGRLFQHGLADLLGPVRVPSDPLEQRHKDIARSVQTVYEKAFFELLQALHKQHPSENLALSGGCAMNSVANGKVYRRTAFKRMYLPAAAGDAGGAIGAAVFVQSKLNKAGSAGAIDPNRHTQVERVEYEDPATLYPEGSTLDSPTSLLSASGSILKHSAIRSSQSAIGFVDLKPLTSAYLGPSSTNEEIHALLDWKRQEISEAGCSTAFLGVEDELVQRTARAIVDGKVVGWFQGRMEWGPRALGNRSILADPRRADMKEILNAKIKRRESFRPFAPSILREEVSEWFEQEDDVPFMMEVFQVRPKRRELIPAVTHADGSGRLQTVHKETNPRYHALISAFYALTDVPMVLNTSFNENEPVVCYPEEALDCFLRTKMDVLVLGDFFLERKNPEEPVIG
jgi:carbamoyltransferase